MAYIHGPVILPCISDTIKAPYFGLRCRHFKTFVYERRSLLIADHPINLPARQEKRIEIGEVQINPPQQDHEISPTFPVIQRKLAGKFVCIVITLSLNYIKYT